MFLRRPGRHGDQAIQLEEKGVGKIKKWLNTQAVERMTLERLTQQDPGGEVLSWLMIIGRLASGHL
jgi:hypothetical protein